MHFVHIQRLFLLDAALFISSFRSCPYGSVMEAQVNFQSLRPGLYEVQINQASVFT